MSRLIKTSEHNIIKEEDEPIYKVVRTGKQKYKTMDLPGQSRKFWRGQFVTTAYWCIGSIDTPWRVSPGILCAVLQHIWESIYQLPYKVIEDSAVYQLVSFSLL